MSTPLNIPVKLKQAAKQGELIIFVGAGLSKKLGLPDWNELIKNILNKLAETDSKYAKFVEILELSMMTPLEILSKIENKKRDVYKALERELLIKDDVELTLHKKILELSKKIITTNYDKAFEMAMNFKANVIPYSSDFKVSTIKESNDYIFKIHGSIDVADECILFESQYKEHYGVGRASSFELEKIFSEKTIMFLGFSMGDPYVAQLFEYIEGLYGKNIDKHYIVTTSPSQFKKFSYLETVDLNSYDDTDLLIDSLIESKQEGIFGNNETVIDDKFNVNLLKAVDSTSILLLHASPIDRTIIVSTDSVAELFNGYNVSIEVSHLNLESLERLIDYDYIIIKTQISRGSIIIEDEYLKAKLFKLADLSDFVSDNIKGIFVLHEGVLHGFNEVLDIPVAFVEVTDNSLKTQLSTFFYKAFRKEST